MTGLKRSPRRRLVAAATILALTALALATALARVPAVSADSPRSGELHLTKSCPPNVPPITGGVAYCTITASNFDAIPVGTKIVYASAANVPVSGWLNSNVVLAAGDRNSAFGHVDLNQMGPPPHYGVVTLWGGTGNLTWFRAGPITVVCSPVNGVPTCSWDGPYTFLPLSVDH